VQGIAAHKADIGFVGSTPSDKKCEYYEFANEKLIFVAPNDGSYQADKEYTLEELLYSGNFISREYGSGTRMQYEQYFTENGILLDKVKICATLDGTYSIINAVISGLGISMVSELAARDAIKQKQLLPIKLNIEAPERKIYTVLNKNVIHSHLIKLFMEYLRVEKNR
jgi:DNA-binding transcriptional LysR family regulator